jgi:hypothetical protein
MLDKVGLMVYNNKAVLKVRYFSERFGMTIKVAFANSDYGER